MTQPQAVQSQVEQKMKSAQGDIARERQRLREGLGRLVIAVPEPLPEALGEEIQDYNKAVAAVHGKHDSLDAEQSELVTKIFSRDVSGRDLRQRALALQEAQYDLVLEYVDVVRWQGKLAGPLAEALLALEAAAQKVLTSETTKACGRLQRAGWKPVTPLADEQTAEKQLLHAARRTEEVQSASKRWGALVRARTAAIREQEKTDGRLEWLEQWRLDLGLRLMK